MNNIRKSYTTYLSLSKESSVDENIYVKICNDFSKYIIKKVLEGFEVTLPSRMGTLSIIGREQNIKYDEEGNMYGLAPNWKETIKLWNEDPVAKEQKKKVYHLNEHTDNIRYRYLWSKKSMLVKNKTLYALQMTRENKRAINKRVRIENQQYKVKL